MSFKSQTFGFVKRIFILKYRNRLHLVSEVVFPLTLLFFLLILNFIFSPKYYKESFPLYEKFPPNHNNQPMNLFMIPNDTLTKEIVKHLRKDLQIREVKYSYSYMEMKDAYISESKKAKKDVQSFGIEFSGKNLFEYTIYIEWSADLFYKDNINLFAESYECNKSSTDILNLYKNCAGNKYVYDGLSEIKYYIDLAIKKVYFLIQLL